MRRSFWANLLARALVVGVALILVGCVPYQSYEMVKNENTRLKSVSADIEQRYNSLIQENLRLQKDGAGGQVLQEKVKRLQDLNNELTAKLGQMAKGTAFTAEEAAKIGPGVELEDGGIRLPEDILFNAGEAKLKSAAASKVLDGLVDLLQKGHPSDMIHITGHTDSDPVSRTKVIWHDNHNLAYNRAYTVFKYFQDKGIADNRMMLHSMAYLDPVDNGTTKEAKAKNRRVVLHLGATKF